MPTSSDFLFPGLVPVNTRIQETECSIYACPFTNPVELPCAHGHVFCRKCIEHWLKLRGKNTCPLDKTTLFDLPLDEDSIASQDRRFRIVQALMLDSAERNPASGFVPYSSGFSIYALQRSAEHAIHYLLGHPPPLPGTHLPDRERTRTSNVSGPAILRIAHLSPSFTAIANLVPTVASVLDRKYARQQQLDWNLVMEHLWCVLKGQDGKKFDALVIPYKLRKAVKNSLNAQYSDAENMTFFFQYSDPSPANLQYGDLDTLLNYLTFCAWNTQRDEDQKAAVRRETKAKRKEAGEEPKMMSRCGPM